MEIIDLTNPEPKKLKPIELISCLQDERTATPNVHNESKRSFYFYESNRNFPILKGTSKIIRLSTIALKDGEYDVIAKYNENNPLPCLFLGHWNDGVVE